MVVCFLSDFGLQDDFVGTCHGVIARIAPDARILDVTHGIPPQAVLQGALGLVCAGLVIGVVLGLLSRRAASRVVTDLPVDSMWPLVLATAAMLAIALVAVYVPTRRAARVEPIEALRQ